jgi:hypothetical protein
LALGHRMNFEKRLAWLGSFSTMGKKGTLEIFAASEEAAKTEEDVDECLELWKLWVRDLTVSKIGGKNGEARPINRDLKDQAAREASGYSFEQLESLYHLICRVQKAITRNANLQLALETLMFEMKKIMKKERAVSSPGKRAAVSDGWTHR